MSAKRLTTIQARQQFSDVCSTIYYGGGRVIVQRRGTDFVAIIPIADFVRLEGLDAIDAGAALAPDPSVTPARGMPAHSPTWHLFHRLWTKAVGTDGYDKSEWLRLERILLEIEKAAQRTPAAV